MTITSTVTIATLREYLLHADERAIFHAHPRHIAQQLNAPHREVLKVLAEATLTGTVTLHWEMQCSKCGAIGHVSDSLSDFEHTIRCVICENQSNVHFDHNVMVTFSPHPSLRALSEAANDPDYRYEVFLENKPTTGHELLTVQAFRDWAQNQTLPVDQSLEVQFMALMFSDLSGSTALYAQRGDPHAYALVREHFNVVFEAVDEAGGSVVKTIGDSVMATFLNSRDALKGALKAHRAVELLNEKHDLKGDDRMLLKIGLHCGPSIMVTLNDRLDYFGQTVNLAARIEQLAQPGSITLSQNVFEEVGIGDKLMDYGLDSIKAMIKGLDEPMVVNRLKVLD